MKTIAHSSNYKAAPVLSPAVTKKPLDDWWQRTRYIFFSKIFIFTACAPLQNYFHIGQNGGFIIAERGDVYSVIFTVIRKLRQIGKWVR